MSDRSKGKTFLADARGTETSQARGTRLPHPRLRRGDGTRQFPAARRTPPLCQIGAKANPSWLTPAVLRHLKRVERDFHIRAFGEEMARVNFLPLAERRRYVADMVDHAVRKGVKFDKPALGVTP